MALTGCPRCLKYLLVVFNIFFGILGCAIVLIGVLAFVTLGENLENLSTYSAFNWSIFAIIFVAAGVLCLLSMCICGCCGAIKEHKLFLILYFMFLFIVFAFFLGVGIYMIVKSESLKEMIATTLQGLVDSACNGEDLALDTMKSLQNTFDCCGANGATDYATCKNIGSAITSCDILSKGCTDAVHGALHHLVAIPAYVVLGIAGFILPGMIISLILFCAVRRE